MGWEAGHPGSLFGGLTAPRPPTWDEGDMTGKPDWVREFGFGAGMGLPNMKKCSDEMTVKSCVPDGTHLTMQFYYTS